MRLLKSGKQSGAALGQATQRGHRSLGPGLVDEDQARRINPQQSPSVIGSGTQRSGRSPSARQVAREGWTGDRCRY
jgi:hypothetical protein